MGYSYFREFGNDGMFVEEDVIIGDDPNKPDVDNASNKPNMDEGDKDANE
jgi:hypothetical protein